MPPALPIQVTAHMIMVGYGWSDSLNAWSGTPGVNIDSQDVLLYCALSWHAMLCSTILRYAARCFATLCHSVLSCAAAHGLSLKRVSKPCHVLDPLQDAFAALHS